MFTKIKKRRRELPILHVNVHSFNVKEGEARVRHENMSEVSSRVVLHASLSQGVNAASRGRVGDKLQVSGASIFQVSGLLP